MVSHRPFRFGVVAGNSPDAESWGALATRAEELGYDVLLAPDSLHVLSPLPALAAAAAVTERIRIGTHVLAVPFRTPGAVARDADTLDQLSGGRFELGLGVGRPDARAEATRLGASWGTAGERLGLLRSSVSEVRAWFAQEGADVPPLLFAGVGDRLMALAAAEADILTLGLPPTVDEQELGRAVERFRRIAGDRGDRVELATNLLIVGDDVPEAMRPFFQRMLGTDLESVRASGAYGVLGGGPEAVAERLACRRQRWGISYVTVGQHAMEEFAAVIRLLHEDDLSR